MYNAEPILIESSRASDNFYSTRLISSPTEQLLEQDPKIRKRKQRGVKKTLTPSDHSSSDPTHNRKRPTNVVASIMALINHNTRIPPHLLLVQEALTITTFSGERWEHHK
jgi:hypothetical protein